MTHDSWARNHRTFNRKCPLFHPSNFYFQKMTQSENRKRSKRQAVIFGPTWISVDGPCREESSLFWTNLRFNKSCNDDEKTKLSHVTIRMIRDNRLYNPYLHVFSRCPIWQILENLGKMSSFDPFVLHHLLNFSRIKIERVFNSSEYFFLSPELALELPLLMDTH